MPTSKSKEEKAVKPRKEKYSEVKAASNRRNALGNPGPTKYSPEMVAAVCEAYSTSPFGLKKTLCARPDLPDAATIINWRKKYPEINSLLMEARKGHLEARLEWVKERAEDSSRDFYLSKEGLQVPHTVAIQRDKLLIGLVQWEASKILGELYGDKVQNEITVKTHEQALRELDDK